MSNETDKSLPPPNPGWGDYLRQLWLRCLTACKRAWPNPTANLKSPIQILLVIVGLLLALFLIYWIFEKIFFLFVARSYVQEIAEAFGLNQYLANAIVYLTFVAIAFFGGMVFRFSRGKRLIGVFRIIGLLVAHSMAMYFATRGNILNKCYVITRNAVIYRERPGIDPETGQRCRAVTPEIVGRLREYEKGKRPTRIVENNPVFFDRGTGVPIVWYYKNRDGVIEMFDLMGFHPDTGEELLPVTKEVVDAWKDQQLAELPPGRVDPTNYPPFDPRTGQPRVWYGRTESGDWAFYDRSGFEPSTGEPLNVLTRDVIKKWEEYLKELQNPRCYVITQTSVKYGDHPGIDPDTGRECRPLTPEMLRRLREYEKGNRPKRIEIPNPTFFDPATGEAIVWYYKDKDGDIQLFNLMGFHPETGEELFPVTKEIVEQWKSQIATPRIPQRVDPEKYAFFDPTTGKPRVWYGRGDKGEYEFYDGPGFQPRTGEKLVIINSDAIRAWKADQQRLQDQARNRALQLDRDKNAAALCDQLAANPDDTRKAPGVAGVPYDSLKYQAPDAIAACSRATEQDPNELRFQYQLARALEFDNPDKALGIQLQLGKLQYSASYDNAGGIFLRKKNYAAALNQFQLGVQHNDPDAMVSLAEMIKRGLASGNYMALLQQAANMGNSGAQQELQAEQQRQFDEQQQQAVQMQTQQRAMEILGNILRRVH